MDYNFPITANQNDNESSSSDDSYYDAHNIQIWETEMNDFVVWYFASGMMYSSV